MAADLRFHHLGLACRDLEAEAAPLLALGYRREGEDFADPRQAIRGRFLIGPGPRLELVTPLGDESPIDAMLAKGIKLYHQAFETCALDDAIAELRAARGKLVVAPVPAVAFGGRQICFVMLPTMMLIELIERP